MTTLDKLKSALRQEAAAISSLRQPLSEVQYKDGFDLLTRGPGWETYQDFIIPQLAQVLQPLFAARIRVSVLEIGPGPRTVLGYLPRSLRRKIGTYTALEPNGLFATELRGWIASSSSSSGTATSPSSTLSKVGLAEEGESRLPCLEGAPDIRHVPFVAQAMDTERDVSTTTTSSGLDDHDSKFDLVLFCHSLYGVHSKTAAVRRALKMLVDLPRDGLVVVFYRHPLDLVVDDDDGLMCHRTATFPTAVVSVPDAGDDDDDDNAALDAFAAFVAGFTTADETTRAAWRGVCRTLGSCARLSRGSEPAAAAGAAALVFAAPETMMAFTRTATTALPELAQAGVPLVLGYGNQPPPPARTVKNREARVCRPAAIARPTDVGGVQACVRWALRHDVGLTVVGGGHSGHCLRPGVVAVDMHAFGGVSVVAADGPLIWAGAGCTTGDIVRAAMAAGLTVPLGARPSVGVGLVLQGGIGHLARGYGLACDAIVGAVVVSVASGEVLRVGRVPNQHLPVGAVQCEEEDDLLWALRGAGTNFGIVVGLTLKACASQTYTVRSWAVPVRNGSDDGRQKLHTFDKLVASVLPHTSSADAYLYGNGNGNGDGLCLGVTLFETSEAGPDSHHGSAHASVLAAVLGPETSGQRVDDIGVFETDMYMSGMHGGHGGGKTSSFKRCVFLKDIGEAPIADVLVAAVATRPTPLCYLHLLHGGGAIRDVAEDATAFGCRDWDFACVVTGVWPRD